MDGGGGWVWVRVGYGYGYGYGYEVGTLLGRQAGEGVLAQGFSAAGS